MTKRKVTFLLSNSHHALTLHQSTMEVASTTTASGDNVLVGRVQATFDKEAQGFSELHRWDLVGILSVSHGDIVWVREKKEVEAEKRKAKERVADNYAAAVHGDSIVRTR